MFPLCSLPAPLSHILYCCSMQCSFSPFPNDCLTSIITLIIIVRCVRKHTLACIHSWVHPMAFGRIEMQWKLQNLNRRKSWSMNARKGATGANTTHDEERHWMWNEVDGVGQNTVRSETNHESVEIEKHSIRKEQYRKLHTHRYKTKQPTSMHVLRNKLKT